MQTCAMQSKTIYSTYFSLIVSAAADFLTEAMHDGMRWFMAIPAVRPRSFPKVPARTLPKVLPKRYRALLARMGTRYVNPCIKVQFGTWHWVSEIYRTCHAHLANSFSRGPIAYRNNVPGSLL